MVFNRYIINTHHYLVYAVSVHNSQQFEAEAVLLKTKWCAEIRALHALKSSRVPNLRTSKPDLYSETRRALLFAPGDVVNATSRIWIETQSSSDFRRHAQSIIFPADFSATAMATLRLMTLQDIPLASTRV
jgi:hypothetical protein